ncbi:hypothetical protein VKT23_000109 [Stygiomarasmius scandens]|uniref:Uncharacterized protein n=1 Tax=Marasmiellus scandens TaxID=2682957 RepID=A0ABR1K493_9AGAR
MFHQHFQSRSLARFHPLQRKAVLKLINGLIESGDENGPTAGFEGHIQSYAGSMILRVIYGIETQEDQDHYSSLVGRAAVGIANTAKFGDYLVDYLPWLKWVPCK